MTTRFDFVLSFSGGYEYVSRPESFWSPIKGANATGSFPAYAKAVQSRGEDRCVTRYDTGADHTDDRPVVDYIVRNIKRVALGDFANVGVVCIAGCSNGSALALAVAAELEACVPPVRLNYIGLVDLPMFAGGRNPAVPRIGACKCSEPQSGDGWNAPMKSMIDPMVDLMRNSIRPLGASAPTIRLDTAIRAKTRENYFQVDGQRVGLTGHWTSTMKFHEVHGAIAGWGAGNINLAPSEYGMTALQGVAAVTGLGDDGLHNKICTYFLNTNDGKILPKLAAALAEL